jgi:hypothetical protein
MGCSLSIDLKRGEELRTKVDLEDEEGNLIPAGAILVIDDLDTWLNEDSFYLEVYGFILHTEETSWVRSELSDEIFDRINKPNCQSSQQ